MKKDKKIFLLLLALGCLQPVLGAELIAYPEVGPDVSFADVLALEFAEPDRKLVYADDEPQLQYGLLWLPADSETGAGSQAPLVIFIHGGCWLNSFDVPHTFAISTALAQAGYAVWSLEYRRTGDAGGGWPGTFDDILAGIEFRQQLQEYPVDTGNFVIMGHSAGGHLALLAGSSINEARAVIGLAAIADLVQYATDEGTCQSAAIGFMGTDPDSSPELYAKADPAQIPLHNTTYLLEGTNDTIVPLSSQPLAGTEQIRATGAGHFDWVHPGTPASRQLLQLLAELFAR